jgi:tRNA (guanine37-N1)-methyltransferase
MKSSNDVPSNPSICFQFITLFPEVIQSYMHTGIIGRAVRNQHIQTQCVDVRQYGKGPYKSVDDLPFGGGPGMVIQAEPIAQAIDSLENPGLKVLLSPNGKVFTQQDAERFKEHSAITFICGRYEGIDARIHIDYVDEVYSVGDYVLSGGELPAMIIADAITRLLPGVLNNKESAKYESHAQASDYLLEHPHYTRPAVWRGHEVPSVLMSGHHAHIQAWRDQQSFELTARVRPELLNNPNLTSQKKAD